MLLYHKILFSVRKYVKNTNCTVYVLRHTIQLVSTKLSLVSTNVWFQILCVAFVWHNDSIGGRPFVLMSTATFVT